MKLKKLVPILLILLVFSWGCSSFASKSISPEIEEKLNLAAKYISANKYNEAVLTYDEIIKIDKKIIPAYKGLSKVYDLVGENQKAESILIEGIKEVDDQDGVLSIALANHYKNLEQNDKAKEVLDQVIADNDKNDQAYINLAQLYLSEQDQDKALSVLEDGVKANGESPEQLVMLARIYALKGNNDEAINYLIKTMELDINQRGIYSTLNMLYQDNGEEILTKVKNNISDKTEILAVINLYGGILTEKYQDVVDNYLQGADNLQQNQRATFITALAYSKLGKKEEALGLIYKINTEEINNIGLLNDLALLYNEIGDSGKAKEIAEKSLALDRYNSDTYEILYSIEEKGIYLADMLINSTDQATELTALGKLSLINNEQDKAADYFKKASKIITYWENYLVNKKRSMVFNKEKLKDFIDKKISKESGIKKYNYKYFDLTGDGVEEVLIYPKEWASFYVLQAIDYTYKVLLDDYCGQYEEPEFIADGQFLEVKDSGGGTGVLVRALRIYRWNGEKMINVVDPIELTSTSSPGTGYVDELIKNEAQINGPISNFEYTQTEKYYLNNKLYYARLSDNKRYTWNQEKFKFVVKNLKDESIEDGKKLLNQFTEYLKQKEFKKAANLFTYTSYRKINQDFLIDSNIYKPDQLLSNLYGDSNSNDIRIAKLETKKDFIYCWIMRENGSTPFYVKRENGIWYIELGDNED